MTDRTLASSGPSTARSGLDVEALRQDFPILQKRINGSQLAYLDNAATTQKPRAVIETMERYYREQNANVHRGVHSLSQLATDLYEGARIRVSRLIGARSPSEIIFVRGTTEAINLVSQAWGRPRLGRGDEILITGMEHHSNIVPWQILCEQTGARLRVCPINERGEVTVEAFAGHLSDRTRLAAMVYVSNALGTVNPVAELTALAHDAGALVLLDGAQAVPHMPVDVGALDCDFFAFSGHKMFGPTGVGGLWARREILEEMSPWQGGGDMISAVSFEKTTYNEVPHKFEAGTPHIAGGIGLGEACSYLQGIGMERIANYEADLLRYGDQVLTQVPRLKMIGTARNRAAVLSFVMKGIHPHDLGTYLDQQGLAVRTGHHCAQPVMDFFGIPATTRASLAFYNTRDELDRLAQGLREAQIFFEAS